MADINAQGLPISLTLGLTSFCFALGVGIPMGFFTAVNKGFMAGLFGAVFWRCS